MIFKEGDKVKIPTTKSQGCSINKDSAIKRAKNKNQDHLFIARITTKLSLTQTTYTLSISKGGWGNYYSLEDLIPYPVNWKERMTQ